MITEKKGQFLSWVVIIFFALCLGGGYWWLVHHQTQVLGVADEFRERIKQLEPSLPSATPEASVSTEQVMVKRVIDGDTIELADGRTLRYIGIDTPETKHPTVGQECFGQEAAERNRQLVESQTVRLEKDVSEVDRYGRLLRYVWVGEQLINQALVEEGYAHVSSFPPDIAKQEQLQAAEQAARTANIGLWASCLPEL